MFDPAYDSERRKDGSERRILFSEAEREQYHAMIGAVTTCGEYWGRLRRIIDGKEQILLVPLGCGRRACEKCATSAQKHHLDRLDENWKQFWTLTIPPEKDLGKWWRRAPRLVRRITQWVRRECKAGRARTADGGPWEYTWSLEEQPGTGMPHWHFLCNIEFIDWRRLREAWQTICKAPMCWINCTEIRTKRGAQWYVCKYVAKDRLPDAVLALLYRKRQWASTVPARELETSGWKLEHCERAEEGQLLSEVPDAMEPGEGWRCVVAAPGRCAMWERPLTVAAENRDEIRNMAWDVLAWNISSGEPWKAVPD